MKESIHQFEVPVYTEPSKRFKSFMANIAQPTVASSIIGKYWRGRLSFTYYNGKRQGASVVPIPENFTKSRNAKLLRKVSIFTSKFNCSMSLLGKDCELLIKFVKADDSDKDLYGTDVYALIRVVVTCKSAAAEVALSTFFTVVENSPLNIGD